MLVYQKSWFYAIPLLEIWHMKDVIVVFHSGLFFALLPPKSPKIKKILKILWLDDVRFLRYGVQWTDEQMDIQWWHTVVGAPPKKNKHSNIANLSKCQLTTDDVSVLELGLPFCSTTKYLNKQQTTNNINSFTRGLEIIYMSNINR